MFEIWLIGAILIGFITAYHWGQFDSYTQGETILPLIMVVLIWPIIVAIAVIISPFWGFAKIGSIRRAKLIEKERNRAVD